MSLAVGDVVTFCKRPEGIMHNALVAEIGANGTISLIHIGSYNNRIAPQLELNVPWQEEDKDGRYYIIEA